MRDDQNNKTINLLPEQLARVKIDDQLRRAGWDVVSRIDYIPNHSLAVKEALMHDSTESDYLLFIDNKAIAIIEAKRKENNLGEIVIRQAEDYAYNPRSFYGFWYQNFIPLVYLANGEKILFKNLLEFDSKYEELEEFHTPKQMLELIGKQSTYGSLPRIGKEGLRDCQYKAETAFENSLINGKKKALAMLATGSGKTYLACLASYRLLNYTPVDRVLFLVDRNNLAKQTESEFNIFDRTEKERPLSTLYSIKRLRTNEDISGTVVISTIQKLFAVLTGQKLIDDDSDEKDDYFKDPPQEHPVALGNVLTLPSDYFKFVVIDECHRSIYGKWQAVLNYFKDAIVLGLTATPTPEAYSFFDNNLIEKYTYEDSVMDGVNVPFRIYDIETKRTTQGGEIDKHTSLTEITKKTNKENKFITNQNIIYTNKELDKTVIDRNQIKEVLKAYRDSIYTDLYPDREERWEYIPKTLIFAKNDKHADEILTAVKEAFGEKFINDIVPSEFVQKITYSAGDSNQLIRNFRIDKNFRIAITVTLVATGTDVKPLEVVMFMADVKSDVLYTQMKGRGCRTIKSDKLKEITPNAEFKECFYIVDAVGVTSSEKIIPRIVAGKQKKLSLKDLIEHLCHGEVSDENLSLLKDYCSTITNRYTNNSLFERHLDEFITSFGYSPIHISEKIKNALESGLLPKYNSPSDSNRERNNLIIDLIYNNKAKDKLLELQNGYSVFAPDKPDELIFKGFSIETARHFIDNFEKYLYEHKDSIEALRIIYNSENKPITYSLLCDLRDKLLSYDRQFTSYIIWKNYRRLDTKGNVDELDQKNNLNALTNLIQLVRYAYKKNDRLFSLFGVSAQRFELYAGSTNHTLTDEQKVIMSKIAEYIVQDGAINALELNGIDTDLWRKGITSFGPMVFASEMQMLSKYIIGAM